LASAGFFAAADFLAEAAFGVPSVFAANAFTASAGISAEIGARFFAVMQVLRWLAGQRPGLSKWGRSALPARQLISFLDGPG